MPIQYDNTRLILVAINAHDFSVRAYNALLHLIRKYYTTKQLSIATVKDTYYIIEHDISSAGNKLIIQEINEFFAKYNLPLPY